MNLFKVIFIISILLTSGCSNRKFELWDTYQRANESYKLGMLSDAEAMYIEITEKNPKLFEVWLKLGNIYVRTNQLDAAIRVYENAVRLNPKDVRAWHNLALTRVKQSTKILMEGRRNMRPDSDEYKFLDDSLKRIIDSSNSKNS